MIFCEFIKDEEIYFYLKVSLFGKKYVSEIFFRYIDNDLVRYQVLSQGRQFILKYEIIENYFLFFYCIYVFYLYDVI